MKTNPPSVVSEYLASLGRLGGPARAKALTKKRRKEIAQMGGLAAAAKRKAKSEE